MVPVTGTVTALTGTMNTTRKTRRATVQKPSVVNELQGKFTCNAYALLVEFIPNHDKCLIIADCLFKRNKQTKNRKK